MHLSRRKKERIVGAKRSFSFLFTSTFFKIPRFPCSWTSDATTHLRFIRINKRVLLSMLQQGVCGLSSVPGSAQPPCAPAGRALLVSREPQVTTPVLSEHRDIIKMYLETGFLLKSNGEVTLSACCQEGLS